MNPLGITFDKNSSRFKATVDIVSAIYRRDGFTGFYRGYVASLCTYVPNSAMWWAFYHVYQGKEDTPNSKEITFYFQESYPVLIWFYLCGCLEELHRILPNNVSHLLIQCIAGTLGGFTTTLLTNPLDIVRARLQASIIQR